VVGVLAFHTVGSRWLVSSLWGTHAYAFLPLWVSLFALASLALFGLAVRGRLPKWRLDAALASERLTRAPSSTVLRPAFLFTGALLVFWLFRARHLLLGDGLVLSRSILQPQSFHPLEPLGIFAQQIWCSWTAPWFRAIGFAERDLAWHALALGSAVCGALFVVVADAIVRQLHRAAHLPEEAVAATNLALLVLLGQGYMQVFFGYVENYALVMLAMAYYAWCALSYLNGRGPLLPVILSCLIAMTVHLSAAALLPSLALVIAIGFRTRRERSFWGEVLAGGLATAVALVLLSQLGGGYDLPKTLLATVGRVASPDSDAPGYIGSGAHALDVINEQILIGPLGLILIGAGLAGLRASGGSLGVRVFMFALVVPYLLVALIAGDSNLGYARNWDLLAPTGFVFALAGLFLLIEQVRKPALRNTALALAVALSFFHTAPWIAVNASLDRGLARFASLPLGGGRTESTLGLWHFRQANYAEAERWLDRSIQANPSNPRAHYWAGRVYSATGRIDAAAAAFERARDIRPDVVTFRLAWINSLVRLGMLEPALQEASYLVKTDPSNPRRWALLGSILLELGRGPGALEAFQRARILEPEDKSYERMTRMVDTPRIGLHVPREDLDALTGM